jgi:hypothetical protein
VQLAVAGKGRNTVVHLQNKECSKLDLTSAQYFWLVDHNDWSMWFAINNSQVHAIPVPVLLMGLPNKKTAELRHLILLSRVTY